MQRRVSSCRIGLLRNVAILLLIMFLIGTLGRSKQCAEGNSSRWHIRRPVWGIACQTIPYTTHSYPHLQPRSNALKHFFTKHFMNYITMLSTVSIQKPCAVQTAALRASPSRRVARSARVSVRAASVAAEDVPSPEKRGIMNLLLLGAIGAPVREYRLCRPKTRPTLIGRGLS
jgi:hypothetical protein